jgi:5-methylcytosine-specific restriction endonuclease McrA
MVQYEETGNTYEYTYQNITGGQYDVYDRKSPEFDNKYKQYAKNRSIQYYEENREELLKKALQYQKENPEKANHYNRIRRGKREKAEGSHTQEEVLQLLVDQDNKCACCDTSFLLVKKHLDHKHPIALGGSNYIENLQWLCAFCNLVKNDSHPDVWEEYSQSEEFKQRRSRRLLTV